MKQKVGDRVPVLHGLREFWFAVLSMLDCPGFVSVWANFAPKLSLDLYHAGCVEKDFLKVQEILYNKLTPLIKFDEKLSRNHGPTTTILCTEPQGYMGPYMWISLIKEAQNIIGLHSGVPRLPLTPLSKEEKEQLAKVLESIGVSTHIRR